MITTTTTCNTSIILLTEAKADSGYIKSEISNPLSSSSSHYNSWKKEEETTTTANSETY